MTVERQRMTARRQHLTASTTVEEERIVMDVKHRRKPYLPDSDLGKAQWMESFLRTIATDPARYGFADAAKLADVQQTLSTFITLARAVKNTGMRSRSTVVQKNDARSKAVRLCREHAMRLKVDPTLSAMEKMSLGLSVHIAQPEQAKLPTASGGGVTGAPLLFVRHGAYGSHVIKFIDGVTTSKAKPKGVSHLLLFGAIGEKPNMRPLYARLLGAYTKRPFEVTYPGHLGLEGKYVTYYGRWLTTRGEIGPWSRGESVIIGGSQVSLNASPFAHLFGEDGYEAALPEGVEVQRPMLEEAPQPMPVQWKALEASFTEKHLVARLETDQPARIEHAA